MYKPRQFSISTIYTLKGLKTSANNTILAFLSISYYDLVVCLCMLNKMVTSKTPCKTLNLPKRRKGLSNCSRISYRTAHTQKRITSIRRCVIHAEQKEKERCHVRGTFYNAEQNSKAKWYLPKTTNEKAFLQMHRTRFREGKMQEKG